jgi:hypothetical protein
MVGRNEKKDERGPKSKIFTNFRKRRRRNFALRSISYTRQRNVKQIKRYF